MSEVHELSALQLAAAIRRRELSAVEVAEHTLERAERIGPSVGAFVTTTPELALEQAREAQKQLDAGGDASLLGVPCPVKDLNQVAGVPFGAGSRALEGYVAPVDDGVVTALREAGTVMVGKTTTPEFGLPCYTEPDVAPPARTPWDTTRSAGGSSGGAAAAVAAGITPVAQASDGGGSIRIPASACGLVGLKPSRGRVSPGPHSVDGPGLATGGALTRDVRDTAVMLDVLSRGWPGDAHLLPPPRTSFLDACERSPARLRIGMLTTPVISADAPVDPACLEAVGAAAELLSGLGHIVDEAPVPFPAERWDAFGALWSVLALQIPVPPSAEDSLVPLTRWLRERGRSVTGLEYANALGGIQLISRKAAEVWTDFDIIMTPTLARPPHKLGELRNDDDPMADFAAQTAFTPWTSVWNLTGRPSISLPLHRAEVDGVDRVEGVAGVTLPIGVMFGAELGAEETLLALGAQLEAADPWPAPPLS